MVNFTKKEQIVILVIVFLVIIAIGGKLFLKEGIALNTIKDELKAFENMESEFNFQDSFIKDEEDDIIIMVHISGQVYKPGLVKLNLGDRVIDAVNLAGGLNIEADLDKINLAKKLNDEEKIYVPKIGEEAKEEILFISSNQGEGTGKININSCSKSELITLPGIGDVIADRIIDYRSSNPFQNIEEIKNVSGIGEKKFEGIKDMIICK